MTTLAEHYPENTPIEFKQHLVPTNKIIHRGVFSPDLKEYYYTISNRDFTEFEVLKIARSDKGWTLPEKAFFNSAHDEHGMSFSPDGNTLYFSSTRPVHKSNAPATWHIWKADKIHEKWNKPKLVDIPNLSGQLLSHPTISSAGTLFFHASKLDYSEMDIYYSKKIDGKWCEAKKASIEMDAYVEKCTPYVSPKEDYLLFASIGKQLDLFVAFHDGQGNWGNTTKLNAKINHLGQGNPYVTPDGRFLFFAVAEQGGKIWKVKWVKYNQGLSIA